MLRQLFHLLLVKPFVLVLLGVNARGREHLPKRGPAIIVANHNSHLDTFALLSMFPQRVISQVRPVAASDYFFRNAWLKWAALNLIGIIPIARNPQDGGRDLLTPIFQALDNNAILILFPEGTRGQPEVMEQLKNGISSIVCKRPQVPVIPVFFYGLGKSLPKGESILVPFFIDAFIGVPLVWTGNRKTFMDLLNSKMAELQAKVQRLTKEV